MKIHGFTRMEWIEALRAAGVVAGDTVYLSTQLYGLGLMVGVRSAEEMCGQLYSGLREVLGEEGTLVVPTFTQQVGRYGVPYVHEETECLTGVFSEYVRRLPYALRSLHPVFSVAAVGPAAHALTADISPVAFGRDSVFDRLYRRGGKAVCAGFEYYSGHITSLMHYVETAYAVPYYYTKYVLAEVSRGGQSVRRDFAINVKYNDYGLKFDYRRYIDALAEAGEVHTAKIGRGSLYSVDIHRQIDIGFQLLSQDIHAFLAERPIFKSGVPPLDGPPDRDAAPTGSKNWSGFLLGGAR